MTVNLFDLLSESGLDRLSDEDKKDLAMHLQTALEQHVGAALTPKLSDEQLSEFEETFENDEEAALAVLREAVPNYQEVVAEQVALLKSELQRRRQEILDAVGQSEVVDG
jgi:hypothetical protein